MSQPTLPGGRRPSAVDVSHIAASRASRASLAQITDPGMSREGGTPAALIAGGLGAIVLLIVIALAMRSTETVQTLESLAAASAVVADAPSTTASGSIATSTGVTATMNADRATDAELAAAKAVGLTALGPLAQRYSKDPVVLKALLLAYAADRSSFATAMRVALHLFDASPAAANDEEVRQVVIMAANGTPEATSAAFDVMGHMGSAGPDLLYELATAPSVGKMPKDRAISLLGEEATLARATPALRIANELRLVQVCQRKPLLPRAREDGDARALHYLKPLEATSGCGIFHRGDCYGCFGNRKELKEAIEVIERRLQIAAANGKK